MGKSDEYQFDYLDDNGRFADQVNGALFKGRQVVRAEELEEAETETVYLGKEAGTRKNFKAMVDKVRLWKGKLLHILAIENQTYVDYHMVFRNMLSESLSYQRQWRRKRAAHEREKDLKAGTDEFLSGMAKVEKFIPVITLVVYYGAGHPWDGARNLYDLLDVDRELKKFISNYRLNLYDCHEHDTFEEYRTGLRQLFEVIRYSGEKEKFKKLLEENRETYSHIDSETRELIEAVGKVRIGEEYESMNDNGEKEYNMCKAFLDMKLEGVVEGREEGRCKHMIEIVCKKIRKNKETSVIADELEEELATVEEVVRIQKRLGTYDIQEIYEALQEKEKIKVSCPNPLVGL